MGEGEEKGRRGRTGVVVEQVWGMVAGLQGFAWRVRLLWFDGVSCERGCGGHWEGAEHRRYERRVSSRRKVPGAKKRGDSPEYFHLPNTFKTSLLDNPRSATECG